MLEERFQAIADEGFAIGIGNFTGGNFELLTTYSEQWQDDYFKLGGVNKDPVVRIGLKRSGLHNWSNSKPNNEFLIAAREHNLCNGLAYSSTISGNRLIAGVSRRKTFSLSERLAIQDDLKEYHLDCLCEKVARLNPLQRSLIQLTAQGWRAKEIAFFFDVSQDAIKQRKSTIQKQIGLNNFTCVTALAARAGFAFHPIN